MPIERRVRIAPSVLSADFGRLAEHVREAERAGADLIHMDIMDGRFVPNITFGPLVVKALRVATRLPLQAHLMIEQPERYIDEFVRAGADMVTVHVETCPHLCRTLDQIREAGARPSVTINPSTPLVSLEEVLDQVELILLMTVNPGFGGQKMVANAPDKVQRLRRMLDARNPSCEIQVDGGINDQTIASIVRAGGDNLVMGAAIFGAEDGVAAAMRRQRDILAAL